MSDTEPTASSPSLRRQTTQAGAAERDRMAEVLQRWLDADALSTDVWDVHNFADRLLAAGFGDVTTRDAALAVAIEERDAARVELELVQRAHAGLMDLAAALRISAGNQHHRADVRRVLDHTAAQVEQALNGGGR